MWLDWKDEKEALEGAVRVVPGLEVDMTWGSQPRHAVGMSHVAQS
jgi:predicted metal-dependent phosphoesterase TrpH